MSFFFFGNSKDFGAWSQDVDRLRHILISYLTPPRIQQLPPNSEKRNAEGETRREWRSTSHYPASQVRTQVLPLPQRTQQVPTLTS